MSTFLTSSRQRHAGHVGRKFGPINYKTPSRRSLQRSVELELMFQCGLGCRIGVSDGKILLYFYAEKGRGLFPAKLFNQEVIIGTPSVSAKR